MPLAPPPPKTTPTDLPHNLRASLAKSLACSALLGRAVVLERRYFCSPLWTLDFKILSAATAAGSCGVAAGLDSGILLVICVHMSKRGNVQKLKIFLTHGQLDMDMCMYPCSILHGPLSTS
jgi:hypothetical protein